MENIVLYQYFQKRCDFAAILTCKIAGIFWLEKTGTMKLSTQARIGNEKGAWPSF